MVEEITIYDKETSVAEYAVKMNSKNRKLVVRLPKGKWKTITHKADPGQME